MQKLTEDLLDRTLRCNAQDAAWPNRLRPSLKLANLADLRSKVAMIGIAKNVRASCAETYHNGAAFMA
jgi:hypothetical protein